MSDVCHIQRSMLSDQKKPEGHATWKDQPAEPISLHLTQLLETAVSLELGPKIAGDYTV